MKLRTRALKGERAGLNACLPETPSIEQQLNRRGSAPSANSRPFASLLSALLFLCKTNVRHTRGV